MILQELTMPQFIKHLNVTKTILIPYGAIEEHGSHLPLNTDVAIIDEALKEVIKKRPVFLAPTIPYGVCTTTKNHPGTISITPQALRLLTEDIVRSVYAKGLRNVLLLSGHGGGLHMAALKEVAERLVEELDELSIAAVSPYEVIGKELSQICETKNDAHAGELETSLMLALKPELVNGLADEEYPALPKPFSVKDKVRYWPGGVWGNPKKATAEKGHKALQIIVDKVIELIDFVEKK